MELIEYQRLYEREKFYWWNVGRRKILRDILERYLPKKPSRMSILDFGCGAGGNILVVKDFGEVTGLDISTEALKFSSDKGFKKLILGDATNLPFDAASFDLVMALDVLEHIWDDRRALSEIKRVLRPGGSLLITVPAHRWLWSEHDEALHHLRRYKSSELRDKLREKGFIIKKESHFVFSAIPFFLFHKLKRFILTLMGIRRPADTLDIIQPPLINNLLLRWLDIERFFMRYRAIPAGSSLLMFCRVK